MTETVLRLKRRADFLKVADARKKWVAPGLIVQARVRDKTDGRTNGKPGADIDPALVRVGFTVSRKVGNAVARNRARRRLRAAVASVLDRPGAAGSVRAGMDLVVIGRTETLTREFPDLIEDFLAALKRLGAWQGAEDGRQRKATMKAGNGILDSLLYPPVRGAILAWRFGLGPLVRMLSGAPSACRFEPSCSAYAEEAVHSHGALKGAVLAIRRIARCHPWGGAGHDPVPAKSEK